jgi:hypothetical protein
MTTTPDLFIIESLNFDDEAEGRCEGKFLTHLLRLTERNVKYFYIRTLKEFEEVLEKFEDSNYRYLHISSHGNEKELCLTLDHVEIKNIGSLLAPYLEKRRVFFSACKLASPQLAAALLQRTGCYSVIGPASAIGFDEAAIFWASFYYLMLRDEATGMKFKNIQKNVANLSKLFDIEMRYFRCSESAKVGFVEVT